MQYVVGQIFERPDGLFKCISFDDMGEPLFERVCDYPLKVSIEDIDTSAGVFDKNGWRHFPDGSIMERTGYTRKPPQDPIQRQRNISYFWQLKLSLALSEFRTCKQHLISLAEGCRRSHMPPPSRDKVDKLEYLKKKADVINKKLGEEDAKLRQLLEPEPAVVDYEQQCEDVKNVIKGIEI